MIVGNILIGLGVLGLLLSVFGPLVITNFVGYLIFFGLIAIGILIRLRIIDSKTLRRIYYERFK